MSKKISVIIPAWNGEKYLAEAIECALNQDYENKEVIVVNDGSTDQSQAVILEFKNQIRSIYQENKGLGAARNTGVRIATGEYFAFLDQDDLWKIEIPGPAGQYTTHNGDGTWKQYRGSGKPHGPIPRPNVKENKNNPSPTGPRPGNPNVREPRPDEIPTGK